LQPGEGGGQSALDAHAFVHLLPRDGNEPHTCVTHSVSDVQLSMYCREPGAAPVAKGEASDAGVRPSQTQGA
jgi:hypothetical protein